MPKFTFPGHRYLGPGNPLRNGEPVDSDDRIVERHDWAYEFSQTDGDVRRVDREAIGEFSRDAIVNCNWHSVVGAAGLGAKYAVETVTGVQYPRDIERGLPTAVKAIGKTVVACQQPQLKCKKEKTTEEEFKDKLKKFEAAADRASCVMEGQSFRAREEAKAREFEDVMAARNSMWEAARSDRARRNFEAAANDSQWAWIADLERKHKAEIKALREKEEKRLREMERAERMARQKAKLEMSLATRLAASSNNCCEEIDWVEMVTYGIQTSRRGTPVEELSTEDRMWELNAARIAAGELIDTDSEEESEA